MPDQTHSDDQVSDDELLAVGLHDSVTGDEAAKLEYEAGAKLAREGKELPTGSTDSAKAGFDSAAGDSADLLNATSNHPLGETGAPLTVARAAEIEREAGISIARRGGTLPDLATDSAHQGFDSVPEAQRGQSETPAPSLAPAAESQPVPEPPSPIAKEGDGTPKVETIMGGDIQHNAPPGSANSELPNARDEASYAQDVASAKIEGNDAPTPVVVHRPLTKKSLPYHATVIAEAVFQMERELAAIGEHPEDGDDDFEPTTPALDELSEGEKDARIAEAAMFVGNAVYGQPETSEFRPNVLWAIARALRPKLVLRHFASTPDVG